MYKLADPHQPIQTGVIALYSFVAFLLVMAVAIHHFTKIPFATFTADPAATFNYSPIYGYVSNIGILLWCSCASICFFSAAVLNIRRDQRSKVLFFLNFGILTTLLMFDDLFMFHESIAPWYLNVPEKSVLACYGLYALGCFYHFRKTVLVSDVKLLAIAAVAFGLSIVIDQISERHYIPGEYLFEDGFKFIGIASWLAYFMQYSFSQISANIMSSAFTDQPKIRRPKVDLTQFMNN
ncbi:MAG: hypothetical protein JNN05_00980 [Candidatus Omnitrophica bacterium]|nr:hypothetical protein [Candidatus Omnitrophota bacterium]